MHTGLSVDVHWGTKISGFIYYTYKDKEVEFLTLRNKYFIAVLKIQLECMGKLFSLWDSKEQAEGFSQYGGEVKEIIMLDKSIKWAVIE